MNREEDDERGFLGERPAAPKPLARPSRPITQATISPRLT